MNYDPKDYELVKSETDLCCGCCFFHKYNGCKISGNIDFDCEFGKIYRKILPSTARTRPTLPDPRTGWTKPMPKVGDRVLVEATILKHYINHALCDFGFIRIAIDNDKIHSIL